MESKLGLQGPAVFIRQHVRQPHSVLLVFKDIHSRKTPSQLGPLTACPSPPPRFPCCFLSQGPLWWATTLPRKLSSVICSPEGICIGTGLPASLCEVPRQPCHPTRGLKNHYGLCSPECQSSASCCTLAGSEDLIPRSIIPRENHGSEVWC